MPDFGEAPPDCIAETPRLWLTPVTLEHVNLMLAIWNDPAFIQFVSDRGIRTPDEAREAIETGPARLFREYGYGPYCLTLKEDGNQIGICGLFKRDILDDPDIGFALLPDYTGNGLAAEAAVSVVAYARDVLALPRLTAIVSSKNAASIALIKKLDMNYERMITMPGETEAIRLYGLTLQAVPDTSLKSLTPLGCT